MKDKKKVYLDICTYCRPFDNQESMRIRLETDAYYLILSAIQKGKYETIITPVHIEEANAHNDIQERMDMLSLFYALKVEYNCNTDIVRARAEELYRLKCGVADSAHIAYAESTADYFITCDDKLLKRCRRYNVAISVFNPVEFVMKEDLK